MPRQKGQKKGGSDNKGTAEGAKHVIAQGTGANKAASGARQAGVSLESLEAERQKVLEQLQGVEEQARPGICAA
jgi:hypothetical protein